MNKYLNNVMHHRDYVDKEKTKIMDPTNVDQDSKSKM